jgi:excisionase family DNA binding protein
MAGAAGGGEGAALMEPGQAAQGGRYVHPRDLCTHRDSVRLPVAPASQADGDELFRGNRWQTNAMAARFLQLADVAEELSVTVSQVYHMVRSGELPAIKIGGRGQWRVERERLEAYIQQKYSETADWVKDNPLIGRDEDPEDGAH